jgi:hypothetical protein
VRRLRRLQQELHLHGSIRKLDLAGGGAVEHAGVEQAVTSGWLV